MKNSTNNIMNLQKDINHLHTEWEKFKNVLIAILIIVLIAVLFRGCQAEATLAQAKTLNGVLGDSLSTWVDKEGNFKAKISVLESDNADYFTQLNTSDSTVNRLQTLVTTYKKQLKEKGSATVITTNAEINLSEPTVVYVDTTKPCDPVYKTKLEIMGTGKYEKTKWLWGSVEANKDRTNVSVKFHEEIDVVIGQEKTGFLGLGKPKPFAEVTLHNPFNTVSTLRSYSTTPLPVKRFGIGPTLSYGIGSGFVPQTFVGIGVSYNFIRF